MLLGQVSRMMTTCATEAVTVPSERLYISMSHYAEVVIIRTSAYKPQIEALGATITMAFVE
jgi:hypothetical protein